MNTMPREYIISRLEECLDMTQIQRFKWFKVILADCCDPEGIRTPNLLIRSQVHYPIMLRDQTSILIWFPVACQLIVVQLCYGNQNKVQKYSFLYYKRLIQDFFKQLRSGNYTVTLMLKQFVCRICFIITKIQVGECNSLTA